MERFGVERFLSRAGFVLALLLFSASAYAGGKNFPAGSPLVGPIHFQFALYYLPSAEKDPVPNLRRWLAREYPQARLVQDFPDKATGILVRARLIDDVQEDYLPPDLDSLRYFGRGLSRHQAEDLQQSRQALILDFFHPKHNLWDALRMATELAEFAARQGGGLLWDEETREIFTADAWHERRLASWRRGTPDISAHVTIHAYRTGEYVRAITLGMAKVGLPDIVVEDFSWSQNVPVGHLINLFSQAMAEGASFDRPGEYDLDLHSIVNSEVRRQHLAALKPNAEGIARLSLFDGTWQEGDPHNRLIEIGFDRYPGPDVQARQDGMLSGLFGSEDSVEKVTHTEELLAASERARAKLPALRDAFNEGLAPGEYILVKAPFVTPEGGNEWMWVEVSRWRGGQITGRLSNDPVYVPDLTAGQTVTVNQQDIFDYIRHHADGTQEGNETADIIRRMNGL